MKTQDKIQHLIASFNSWCFDDNEHAHKHFNEAIRNGLHPAEARKLHGIVEQYLDAMDAEFMVQEEVDKNDDDIKTITIQQK